MLTIDQELTYIILEDCKFDNALTDDLIKKYHLLDAHELIKLTLTTFFYTTFKVMAYHKKYYNYKLDYDKDHFIRRISKREWKIKEDCVFKHGSHEKRMKNKLISNGFKTIFMKNKYLQSNNYNIVPFMFYKILFTRVIESICKYLYYSLLDGKNYVLNMINYEVGIYKRYKAQHKKEIVLSLFVTENKKKETFVIYFKDEFKPQQVLNEHFN